MAGRAWRSTGGVAVLALALAGCATYGRVDNPAPVLDLESPVSIENVMRAALGPTQTVLQISLRIHAPPDSAIRLSQEPIEVYALGDTTVIAGRGELEGVRPAEGGQPAVEIAPGRETRVNAVARLPRSLAGRGKRVWLRARWTQGVPGDARGTAHSSRLYRTRVVGVNYTVAALLGVGMAGAVIMLGGQK